MCPSIHLRKTFFLELEIIIQVKSVHEIGGLLTTALGKFLFTDFPSASLVSSNSCVCVHVFTV